MTRTSRLLTLAVVLVLAWAGLVLGQGNSPGGVFDPARSIRLSGVFTWRETLSPIIIEGDTDDAFETTLTWAEPTADRTLTFANATGNVMLAETAATAGFEGGTVTLDGSNPTSVTTGLSALSACTVHTTTDDAPALGPIAFTILRTAVAGRLDIYAWAATSTSNPSLIASTSTRLVEYLCSGTP